MELTEVWFGSEMPRSVVVGEVWAAGRGGARGGGRSWGAPGSEIPLSGSECTCGCVAGVRKDRNTPAAWNCGDGATHRRWRLV